MDDIRAGTCPLCRHNRIVRSHPGIKTDDGAVVLEIAPRDYFAGAFSDQLSRPLVWAFTCQRCGFTQQFVTHPERIPLDEEKYSTQLIEGPDPAGPYR